VLNEARKLSIAKLSCLEDEGPEMQERNEHILGVDHTYVIFVPRQEVVHVLDKPDSALL
jgi:hypothetical protein